LHWFPDPDYDCLSTLYTGSWPQILFEIGKEGGRPIYRTSSKPMERTAFPVTLLFKADILYIAKTIVQGAKLFILN